MTTEHEDLPVIEGAGGGKAAKSHTPVEEPNNLQSVAKGRILDLIAHGPIKGLVDGLKSIYLDDTPLQNADGSFNFEGVVVTTRDGQPDQDVIPGFRAVESVNEINTELLYNKPVVRSVGNNDADALLVTVQVQGLAVQKENGDMVGGQVSLSIDVRTGGGGWVTLRSDTIAGKTTAPYQRTYRLELNGDGPFDVRVVRTTPDSTDSKIQDKLSWVMLTEVVDARLSYPDSALVGLEVNSKLFGSKIPSRRYDMYLSIIQVPSNYDPQTRTYSGLWDGTFKHAWSDNPAWCFYDLATHPIIGAANKSVDKWWLYRIAQYCDELVPDGYGKMEPRFTCNTLFGEQQEAITTLNTLASVFRGMCYWGSDTIMAVADMPADPVKLVAPANVVNGDFQYSGTSLRDRHSVAVVMWNDPEDNYKLKPEIIEDPESIQLFGWRETKVTAVACTSRGQARRLGKWILYSERMETETVTYEAALDHADLRPGDIIQVADPDRAGARLGGRIMQILANNTFELDKVPDKIDGQVWYLSAVTPAGPIERQPVQRFTGNQVRLTAPFTNTPIVGALWVLSSASVTPPSFRVVSVKESEDKPTFSITATEYHRNKYAFVERDLLLPEAPDTLIPTGPVAPPLSLKVEPYKYLAGGTEHQGLHISWTKSNDVRASGYVLEVKDPDDVAFRTIYNGSGISFDELDALAGEWMIRVRAVSSIGTQSPWVSRTFNVAGLLLPAPPDSIDVEAGTFSVMLTPRSMYPTALYEFWRASVALTANQIESNAKKLTIGTNLVDTNLRAGTTYFYYVRGVNVYGVSSWVPAQATTLEDFEDILRQLDEDIRKPGGLFEDMVNEASAGLATEAAKIVGDDLVKVRKELADAEGKFTLLDGKLDELDAGLTTLEFQSDLESVRYLANVAMHEGASARSTTEESVRADEDEAMGKRVETLRADFDKSSAVFSEELKVLATADAATTQQLTKLSAKVNDDITAAIEEEKIARTDALGALSSQMTKLDAKLNKDIVAAIANEESARADGDKSLATRITTMNSTFNDQVAGIRTEYSTKAYADGAVARAVITATANGRSAVFGISVNGQVSEIGAIADRFYVYNPYAGSYTLAFAVADGRTVIQDALIRDGSITNAKIGDTIQSNNYQAGVSGWCIKK